MSVTRASDAQICRQCRGQCCQGHPGLWVEPDRFLAFFFHGEAPSPDEFEHHLPALGLKLRRVTEVPIPSPIKGACGCIFLGPGGCRLPEEERPCQCLALVPEFDTLLDDVIHCRLPPDFGTDTARRNWEAFWRHQPL